MRALRRLLVAVLALAVPAALPATANARTVWLCKPGLRSNPCAPGLDTTRFSPAGRELRIARVERRRPQIDCFYVYPTVSDQPTPAADRRIDPELRSIALYQAARYSRDCRVYAPVYRQITIAGPFTGGVTAAIVERAYRDVRGAWRTYLRHFNRGRGVVLIGHSQGTFLLRRLVREEVDGNARVRRRLVSAVLLGGNVTVRAGADSGGDFRHLRACRSGRQLHCVVAFSTFDAAVPADARFGRSTDPGLEVLCTNPAALAGGEGLVDPILPRARFAPGTAIGLATEAVGFPRPPATTPWLSFPGSYTARCSADGGANMLQVSPREGAPALNPTPDATWGLHLVDANIALGNLTRLVRRQAAAYVRGR
jgi:Protein of unknown function (DUF3089)